MLFLVLMLPPKPRPRLPMQSGHGSAPPASGVVHGHPDRWCSRHCRRPSRALRRVCAVSTAARQFDVQPVFAALAICSRCETRLIPEQRWPVQPPASSVSCSRVVQPATSPSPCRTSASAGGSTYGTVTPKDGGRSGTLDGYYWVRDVQSGPPLGPSRSKGSEAGCRLWSSSRRRSKCRSPRLVRKRLVDQSC